MSAADLWCAGFMRNPHVPSDRALIEVRQPTSFHLCRTCWIAYNAANYSPVPKGK